MRTHIRTATDDADRWAEQETTNAITAEPLNGIPGHALVTEPPPSSPPSQASGVSTSALSGPGGDASDRPKPTRTGVPSSQNGSPESPAPPTSEVWGWSDEMMDVPREGEMGTLRIGTSVGAPTPHLIFSVEGSPAKTSASPDADAASPGTAPASSSLSPTSPRLFDLDGFSSRTYPGCSPRTAVGTSESCLARWPTSGTAWHGGFSTAASSECPSADGACSSSPVTLADMLEPSAPAKYSLSARAAAGILRRAEKRGRSLPESLALALTALAGDGTRKEASS